MTTKRTIVFIDGAYLSKILEGDFNSIRIDLHHFANKICNGGEMLRCYYYTCKPHLSDPPTKEELEKLMATEKFVKALEMLPNFKVRLGHLIYEQTKREYIQKQVDVQMAVDMVTLVDRMDRAIVVTGDLDFVPAIEYIRERGVQVELFYMPTKVYRDLAKSVDVENLITENLVQGCKMPQT